jgi:hypothetical protein
MANQNFDPPFDDIAQDIADAALNEVNNKEAFAPLEWPMVIPDGAGFGIQSEVLTYGPWVTMGPAGTVRVDHDGGLTPWEYGGYTIMNIAGQSKANEGITYMQVGERGSVSIPGYPTIPLGAELGAIDAGFYGAGQYLIENRTALLHPNDYATVNMGAWTGLHGPNVTDISVSVGTDGVSTNYNMRTYTPKFGRFTKSNAESLRRIGQNKLKIQRESAIARANLGKGFKMSLPKPKVVGQILGSPVIQDHGKVLNQASPHSMLVGSLNTFKSDFKRTTISTLEMQEVSTQYNGFGNKAFMGFDGLVRPISMDGDGGLPQYANYTKWCNVTLSRGMQPPVYVSDDDGETSLGIIYNSGVHQDYLNPLSNPTSKDRSDLSERAKGTGNYVGHDWDLVGRHTESPTSEYGTGLSIPVAGYGNTDDGGDYYDDYRAFALRGPMLLQSWGYDTDGKPIPNYADDEMDASGGTFVASGLNDTFLSKWLRKPHTWPVAPVDLRFDRDRGVWTVPTYRLLYAIMEENLCSGGPSVAKVDQDKTGVSTYSPLGVDATDVSYIQVYSRTDGVYPSGTDIIAYYDPVMCQYAVLEGKAPEIYNWQACESGADIYSDSLTSVGTFNEIILGTGLYAHSLGGGNWCHRKVIESNIIVVGNSASGTGDVAGLFQRLIFGSGLTTEWGGSGNPCTYTVTASGIGNSGVNVIDDEIFSCSGAASGEITASGNYSTIVAGYGLSAVAASGSGAYAQINLSMDVGDLTGISSLSFGDCLQVTEGDNACDAKIGFASGILPEATGRIWYVSDVECSGQSIVITKKYFDYSDCGTIIEEGEEA